MISSRYLVLILSVLVLSVGDFAVSAQGKARQCATEECACEEALKQNSVEALEEFLKKYPHSTGNEGSACSAVALPPLGGVSGSGNQDNDSSGTSTEPALPSSNG